MKKLKKFNKLNKNLKMKIKILKVQVVIQEN